MRLAAAVALAHEGITQLSGGTATWSMAIVVIVIAVAALLVTGLWTPIAGTLTALIQVWKVFAYRGDPWLLLPLGTLGVALALLGPGAWSVDAHLFGWKRIDIRNRKS